MDKRADDADAGLDRAAVLDLAGGNEPLVSELIETFLEEGLRRLGEIDSALADGDADRLQIAAHTLKGSAMLFSAPPTVETARELERCGRETDLDRAREIARRLHEQFARLREALLRWDRELGGQA